jgi:hypothetical protein
MPLSVRMARSSGSRSIAIPTSSSVWLIRSTRRLAWAAQDSDSFELRDGIEQGGYEERHDEQHHHNLNHYGVSPSLYVSVPARTPTPYRAGIPDQSRLCKRSVKSKGRKGNGSLPRAVEDQAGHRSRGAQKKGTAESSVPRGGTQFPIGPIRVVWRKSRLGGPISEGTSRRRDQRARAPRH